MNQSDMTLPERLIHTTGIHRAFLANEDGQLALYHGERIPATLRAALKDHKADILKLLKQIGNQNV